MLWPVIQSISNPPTAASGTVIITTIGVVKEANSPASTRYMSNAASRPTSTSWRVVRCCSVSAPVTCQVTPGGLAILDTRRDTS